MDIPKQTEEFINGNGVAHKYHWEPLTTLLSSIEISSRELSTCKMANSEGIITVHHPVMPTKTIPIGMGVSVPLDYLIILPSCVTQGLTNSIREHPENWEFCINKHGYVFVRTASYEVCSI